MQQQSTDRENQLTLPLSITTFSGSFHNYLEQYHLLWCEVARMARVPVIVVWSIDHDLPVSSDHAQSVRTGLRILTGVPFDGPIQTSHSR